jgi:hypothetical protein
MRQNDRVTTPTQEIQKITESGAENHAIFPLDRYSKYGETNIQLRSYRSL